MPYIPRAGGNGGRHPGSRWHPEWIKRAELGGEIHGLRRKLFKISTTPVQRRPTNLPNIASLRRDQPQSHPGGESEKDSDG